MKKNILNNVFLKWQHFQKKFEKKVIKLNFFFGQIISAFFYGNQFIGQNVPPYEFSADLVDIWLK